MNPQRKKKLGDQTALSSSICWKKFKIGQRRPLAHLLKNNFKIGQQRPLPHPLKKKFFDWTAAPSSKSTEKENFWIDRQHPLTKLHKNQDWTAAPSSTSARKKLGLDGNIIFLTPLPGMGWPSIETYSICGHATIALIFAKLLTKID